MDSKDLKKIILGKLSDMLQPKQFKKSGNWFVLSNGDLSYYIGLQSSQQSTEAILKITVNIEIASAPLCNLEETSLPEKDRRHYIKRIGSFIEPANDKWWTIDSPVTAENAAAEIISLLTEHVLPAFSNLKTTAHLVELWKRGDSPGLTNGQKKAYLDLLGIVT